jgi:hypothetical protein
MPNLRMILSIFLATLLSTSAALGDSISSNPIVFVTMVPNPQDFGTLAATFGNHIPNPGQAFRGGDLYIRYPDGTLKNLTLAAGYGNAGFQGANSIAVRDPSVHWNGLKVIFSMVVGAATQQYQLTDNKWQLYEITGLAVGQTPVITKVPNQPSNYNNHSPIYTSDDSIIFISDRPRDNSVLHTYPQRDEYESSPVNSGLWKLNPSDGVLSLLDHAPSGDFNPIIDSYGRVIFTRWDHLQRDQQNIGASMNAFNFVSEESNTSTGTAPEVFPEPRSVNDPDYNSKVNLFTINQFFPWMMNQDGTDMETLNHIGRQEIGVYSERSFNDDPNVQEFYGQYQTGANQNEFSIFLHIKESQTTRGTYLGTNCQEFGTHSSGQIISLNGSPGVNPDNMLVTYLTHPDTSGATNTPNGNHSGLYRDPLPLSNGNLIAAHTSNTQQDANIGSSSNPQSKFSLRLKLLTKSGTYFTPSTLLTSGISKTVNFWSPDSMVNYSGTLWEVMPVELVARNRPTAALPEIPDIEKSVIAGMNVSLTELQNYLTQSNLALVVSRNITVRDRNDRQQPSNLRVFGTTTQAIPNSGKIYDLSLMQFLQGDLIRGYASGSNNGRRVLAQHMHSVASGINPESGGPTGTIKIADDGSMAAFVPARRALSWEMLDPNGKPVVRERYWLTFQPGEIRVCASCHGVNTADHGGNPAPTNPPLALAQLIAHWKNLPMPTPTPGVNPGDNPKEYALKVQGLLKGGKKFIATARAPQSIQLSLRASVNGRNCGSEKVIPKGRVLTGRFPNRAPYSLLLRLSKKGDSVIQAEKKLKISRNKSTKRVPSSLICKELIRSLK